MSMFLIFIGPPGCGKGTQVSKLAALINATSISLGDLIRKKVNSADLLNSGFLMNDDFVNSVFLEAFDAANENQDQDIIIDGYPRTLSQAFFLEKLSNTRKVIVFFFKIQYDLLFRRISGRISCKACGYIYNTYFHPPLVHGVCDKCGFDQMSVRSDDKEEVLVNRLKEYDRLTVPLLDYYKELKVLYELDAEKSADSVLQEILEHYNNSVHASN